MTVLFIGYWMRRREDTKRLANLRAWYLSRECDLETGIPSEDDFQMWLEYQVDPDEIDMLADAGGVVLEHEQPPGALGDVWQAYQRTNQGLGLIQWTGRVIGWLHGLWF